MSVTYRIMTPDDFAPCANELIAAFAPPPWNESWTFKQAFERIDEIMSARVSSGYVAIEDGAIAAMACGRLMTYLDFKELWIDEFSVAINHRRRGIGSGLIAFIRAELKNEKDKINYISLNTERGYPSVDFYEHNGFKADEHILFMSADA